MQQDVLLIVLSIAVLLVRAGMAMHACGVSRSKNAASALLRSGMDMAIATLGFWFVGARLFPWNWHSDGQRIFALVLVLIGNAPAIAATAERSRWLVVAVNSILLSLLIIPLTGQWVWGGFLHERGFVDVGGASALHLTVGVLSAIAAGVVGPRSGKYNQDGSANAVPGHSIPLSFSGTLLIFIGWIAYLAGASILRGGNVEAAAVQAILAASAGALAGAVYGRMRFAKTDVFLAGAGMMGALVAISAGAGLMNNWYATLIGAAAGLVVPWALLLIDLRLRLDDPGGAVAIHGVGGAMAIVAGAIVNRNIVVQLLGLCVVGLVSFALGMIVLTVLKLVIRLRVSEAEEFDGLDLAEHDINAYPDFQQTMIKSYHLREV